MLWAESFYFCKSVNGFVCFVTIDKELVQLLNLFVLVLFRQVLGASGCRDVVHVAHEVYDECGHSFDKYEGDDQSDDGCQSPCLGC